MKDIIETIRNLGQFGKFIKLIELTGHIDSLKNCSSFTMLVPTDKAMVELESEYPMRREYKDYFLKVLKKHVIKGKCDYACLRNGERNWTMDGEKINLDLTTNQVNLRSYLVMEDIKCKNGMIHVIDKAMIN